jgi:hypothetical protein
MEELQLILEKSVAKNGADHVITLGHLLNIVKMVNKCNDIEYQRDHESMAEAEHGSYLLTRMDSE